MDPIERLNALCGKIPLIAHKQIPELFEAVIAAKADIAQTARDTRIALRRKLNGDTR